MSTRAALTAAAIAGICCDVGFGAFGGVSSRLCLRFKPRALPSPLSSFSPAYCFGRAT